MHIPDPDDQPTMSVEETAKALSLGRSTAYEGVRSGQIPSIRVGRRIRVPTAAVRRLLQLEVETPS
jgi:excisionase family DNA binding protein